MGAVSFGTVKMELLPSGVVVLTELRPTARVEDFLGAFNALLARGEVFVCIHDVRRCSGWDTIDRAAVHQWLRERIEPLRTIVRGHCAVLANQQQRGMATAVFWEPSSQARYLTSTASRPPATGRRSA